MKKLLVIVLSLVMVLSMAACSMNETPAEAPTKAPAEIFAEVSAEEPAEEPTEEPAKELTEKPIKEATKEPAKELTEKPIKEATKEPAKELTEKPTKEPIKETPKEPVEAPAAPTKPAACEHRWGVDQANGGRILYRCELCDAVKDEVDPNYKPAKDPAECAHRWERYGEGETGMFLNECIDCGALDLEYVCPHDMCREEQLTNSDGAAYTRYTCIRCGYTYNSEPVEVPVEEPDEAPEDPAECAHRWECYGEGETGMFLYECMDCDAMYLEYVCPHEFCTKTQQTNPDDGSVYTQNTCIGCGYTFVS